MSVQATLDALSAPHVARSQMISVEFPNEVRYYHLGAGKLQSLGKTWLGVNDPAGAQIVSMTSIQKGTFGEAPYIDIVMSAATSTLVREYLDGKADFEGASCNFYQRIVDQETNKEIVPPRLQFEGRLTQGKLRRVGTKYRTLAFTVVSLSEGLNFPAAKFDWSNSAQQQRYPGDRGLEYIDDNIQHEWKP